MQVQPVQHLHNGRGASGVDLFGDNNNNSCNSVQSDGCFGGRESSQQGAGLPQQEFSLENMELDMGTGSGLGTDGDQSLMPEENIEEILRNLEMDPTFSSLLSGADTAAEEEVGGAASAAGGGGDGAAAGTESRDAESRASAARRPRTPPWSRSSG